MALDLLCLTAMTDLRGANAQATGSLKLGVLTDMSSLCADNGPFQRADLPCR
jgi:hypothetical protein